MMKRFIVYAENGDWEVYANDAEEARRLLVGTTMGRCGRIDRVKEAK